jgi:tRNA(Met) cytidine acetyltransferase
MPPGVMVVTAPRGRGNQRWRACILRVWQRRPLLPHRDAATDVLAHYAGEMTFIAPDALLTHCPGEPLSDWLIVDEAAAIPGPLLTLVGVPLCIIDHHGAGLRRDRAGLLTEILCRFSSSHTPPVAHALRWAEGCPLEAFISRCCCLTMRRH